MQQPPSNATEPLFRHALQHHQAGRLGDAERDYQRVLEMDPRHADALHFLGVLAQQTQRLTLAADLIARAIAINGNSPVFHNNLGNVLHAQGRTREAAAAYQRAVHLKPDYAGAHFNLGIVLQTQGHLAEAAEAYARAIATRPDYAEAHCNLGNVLQAQGKHDEAIAAYRQALRLRPNFALAHGNMANVLKARGSRDEALNAYREAIRHLPAYVEAHNNRAILLLEMDRLGEAHAACHAALGHDPRCAATYTILGNVLREQGRVPECLAAYQRAVALAPQNAEARLAMTVGVLPLYVSDAEHGMRSIAEFSRSVEDLARWHAGHPGLLGRAVGMSQPFYLAYRPGNLRAPLARYGELMCAAAAQQPPPQAQRASASVHRDRVRLVIVCGQVRRHPVWDVILRGMVTHIDRGLFELSLYHTGALLDDETHWAASHVDHFVQGPKPTAAWLSAIMQAAPDVIFYPEVGMDPTTCALAAHRLAPRQLASWGHPVTTGLPTLDHFLSARLLEPEGAEAHYSERLVHLPGTGVCTEAPDVAAREWHGPNRAPSAVRFALCHQPIKFDPADDVLLARIAKAVGPSEFWLVSPQRHAWATALLRERLGHAFRAQGLDPDAHIRVAPWMTRPEFCGFLDAMDVYLDCPAFSGYTTAWQAVHRGLPVVTLDGPFLRQRLAAGLLRQIGDTAGICADGARYVDLAVQWATESRNRGRWTMRRDGIAKAAAAADGNLAAVRAVEQSLLGA